MDKGQKKVALLVGGSKGIGLEASRQLLASGWRVCLTGRRPENLDEAARSLGAGPTDLMLLQGRSQDAEHQRQTVAAVRERWGRLDGLVNCAATSPFLGDVVDASVEHFERGFATNVIAPWAWIKCVCESGMRESGGSIVNVASIGGTYVVPRVGVYNVTKAALIHLTRQLALELAPKVRINSIAPATIKTDFARAKYEGREQEVAEQFPLKRLGTPEEVGGAIVMLLDERLGWMTGQTLVLDGGASLIQGVK